MSWVTRRLLASMSISSLLACGSVTEDGGGTINADDSRRDYGGATDYGEDTPPERGPCAGECANDKLSPCTCSSDDPCGWASDGVCESSICVHFGYVTRSYDDGSDCEGVEMPSLPEGTAPSRGGSSSTSPTGGAAGASPRAGGSGGI